MGVPPLASYCEHTPSSLNPPLTWPDPRPTGKRESQDGAGKVSSRKEQLKRWRKEISGEKQERRQKEAWRGSSPRSSRRPQCRPDGPPQTLCDQACQNE